MRWRKGVEMILLLFGIYLLVELVRKIVGGSLGFEELITGLLIINLGYLFHINTKLSRHLGWHEGKEGLS